jgi:hypothetical protein
MKAIGSVLRAPLKLLGIVPKMPKLPEQAKAIRPVTRDDARDAALSDDELARRRGAAANQMTGAGGAEAGATGKATLG